MSKMGNFNASASNDDLQVNVAAAFNFDSNYGHVWLFSQLSLAKCAVLVGNVQQLSHCALCQQTVGWL